MQVAQELPDVSAWGWKDENESYQPIWMKITEASKALKELERCSCQRNCGGRCSCKSIDLAKNFANEMDSVHRSFSSKQVL